MSKRIRQPVSLILAYAACIACLCGIIPMTVLLPGIVGRMMEEAPQTLFVTIVLYIGMAIAAAVLVLLLFLLGVCRRGEIFSTVSGRLVRLIAVLVMAEGGVFALLATAILPILFLAVTVVAVTMGLCFLVVSHVLYEAARLKEENDATI